MVTIYPNEITRGIDAFITNDRKGNTPADTIHLIQGGTGSGKTFSAIWYLMPRLVERNCVCISYGYPTKEIGQPEELRDLAKSIGYTYTNNIEEAIAYLTVGMKVVFDYCDRSMGSEHWVSLTETIYGPNAHKNFKGCHIAHIIDEAHARTVSDPDILEETTGFPPVNFHAVYVTTLINTLFAKGCRYVFGLTATPTREHHGLVSGRVRWQFINERPAPSETMCAAFGGMETFDVPEKKSSLSGWQYSQNYPEVRTNLLMVWRNMIRRMLVTEIETGYKMGALYIGGKSNNAHNLALDKLVGPLTLIVQEEMERLGLTFTDEVCAQLLSTDKTFLSARGYPAGKIPGDPDQTVKVLMDAPDHPLRVMFVMEKGKMGMNIGRLKNIMIGRHFTTKEDAEIPDASGIYHFIEQILQMWGRGTRLHPMNSFKFSHNGSYDLISLIETCSEEELETLLRINTIHVAAPDVTSQMYQEAVEDFKRFHARPADEIRRAWVRMRQNAHQRVA